MLASSTGRWRPLLGTAVFTGTRSSELRRLRWSDVDFERAQISVHQRADDYGAIGRPKPEAGERTIPGWKLACPRRVTGNDAAGNPVRELH
ncbi:tyrosine-type recombinase/integrase [Mesorhizobium sp. M0482]|uniref:hypothetical protein n=1 Tax=unclassified Mesorhizobium TaxID=325217 RepID=UPI003336563F